MALFSDSSVARRQEWCERHLKTKIEARIVDLTSLDCNTAFVIQVIFFKYGKWNILKDNEFYRISPDKYTNVDWVSVNWENWGGRGRWGSFKVEVCTRACHRPQTVEEKVLGIPWGLDSIRSGKRKWQ